MSILDGLKGAFSPFFNALSSGLGQTMASYCELETADSETVLVYNDGSLLSLLKIKGIASLVGKEEFSHINNMLLQTLRTSMSQPGHRLQVFFSHDKSRVDRDLKDILYPSVQTAKQLNLDLDDFFSERINHLKKYCSHEDVYLVLSTQLGSLTKQERKYSHRDRMKVVSKDNVPPFIHTQNPMAGIADLRDSHDAFVSSVLDDFNQVGLLSEQLDVHDALCVIRKTIDPNFTDDSWRPLLPGDKVRPKMLDKEKWDISDILWPSLKNQLFSRDAYNIDLKSCRIGDSIYSGVYVDLFPQDIQPFMRLFSRVLQANIPWRISFDIVSDGLANSNVKRILSSLLAFTSKQNRLISSSLKLLNYIELNTDDSIVKLRVCATTWAPEGQPSLLRTRLSQLARAVEGWGSCDVAQFCGDAFAGTVSSMLGVSQKNVSATTLAPLSDVLYMLPIYRPASLWETGAILFRSPDGRLLPYHPGSTMQTTFIDLIYARPGSGKSVMSNAMNLAVCLSPGISRLPRIAIIDIGPSSSGLIAILKDALPINQRHLVAHHRLRMTPKHSINPFDTQLGCRQPSPQDRAFLVNFLTLLATPVGSKFAYDGISDMVGLVVDELYKNLQDANNPNLYSPGVENRVDGLLEEIGFITDDKTSWWEVCDALFLAGFYHDALLSQRHAMPVLADVTSICRTSAVSDLYGRIVAPTGEPLIQAFSRMISAAVREYPILSQVTQFDIGDARIVALDLDEVARTGGEAATRQTGVMYMLARYILARDYFLSEENLGDVPDTYRSYHKVRIDEIREDTKRIVFDEFHRTANAQAVRDQVIADMREGRKWKVQISLLSQSLDDFDETMVEFATSVFIMDAGPQQAVNKTAKIFGLTDSAKSVLKNRVHGPDRHGSTFLAQFATKKGVNTQLLTLTLGPIELWALNTTAEDAFIRRQLTQRVGAKNARLMLAKQFPGGSAVKHLEERYTTEEDELGFIDDVARESVMQAFIDEILTKGLEQLEL